MDEHGIEQSPRARQAWFVYACNYCRHAEACRAGETDLLISPVRDIRDLVAEESARSSTLTAAASRLPPRRADRVSILKSLRSPTNKPSRQEFDRGLVGRNHFESWAQFVDVEKFEYNPFKNPRDSTHSDIAKSLIGLGSRTERCPTPDV